MFDSKNDSNSNKGIRVSFPPSNHCTLIYIAEYISNIYIYISGVYICTTFYHFIRKNNKTKKGWNIIIKEHFQSKGLFRKKKMSMWNSLSGPVVSIFTPFIAACLAGFDP